MAFWDTDLADALGRVAGTALTYLTKDDDGNRVDDPSAVQDKFNDSRDDVRAAARKIGFEGGFRPPSVHSTDNFEQHDLATLRAKVDKIDVAAVNDLKDAWGKISGKENTSLTTFQKAMDKATNHAVWRGQACDAAAQAVSDYTTHGSKVANAAELTGNKLAELATGLEPTKKLVPHAPDHRSGVTNAVNLISGRGWRDDVAAYDNAYAEAKRVLKTVYAPVVHESDTGVPVIPLPPQPGNGPGDQPPPARRPGGKEPGQSVGPGNDSNGPDSNSGVSEEEPTGEQNSQGRQEGPNPQSNPSGDNQAGSQQPGDSAKTDPSSLTTPAGVGPSSFGSGSSMPGSVPGGIGGGLGGSSSAGGPPGSGSSVPFAAQPAAGAGPGSRAGAAASGRAGMHGMPGMGAGRGRGDQDEEREKETPDYLINQDNGDELTGIPDLPKAVPPVIGG